MCFTASEQTDESEADQFWQSNTREKKLPKISQRVTKCKRCDTKMCLSDMKTHTVDNTDESNAAKSTLLPF